MPPNQSDRPNNFGPVAAEYEQHRSHYPPGLVEDILEASDLAPGASLLEIGSGTGRATRLFTGREFRITCIEPIPEMSAIARELNGDDESIRYVHGTFEGWDAAGELFDLVYSGQAFHWIDPEVGYARLVDHLRPGGAAALFWYTPSLSNPDLVEEVDRLYIELAPEIGTRKRHPSRFDNAGRYLNREPGLGPLSQSKYRETRNDTAEQWTAMLRTTSDHLALPEGRREMLIGRIGDAIERYGHAEVTVTTRLWVAKRTRVARQSRN